MERSTIAMATSVILLSGGLTAAAATRPVRVDCDAGGSINATLAKLPRSGPNTLLVSGTCREHVVVQAYDLLRIEGAPGAVLMPDVPSPLRHTLDISSSRAVVVTGLTIRPGPEIGIALTSCQDCAVERCRFEGSLEGSGVGVAVEESGFARILDSSFVLSASEVGGGVAVFVGDASAAKIGRCSLEAQVGWPGAWAGLMVMRNGSAVVWDSTFRGFGVGMHLEAGGWVNLFRPPEHPGQGDSMVVVEHGNCGGIWIGQTAELKSEATTRLRVKDSGPDCWASGISMTGGSLALGGPVEITNSVGPGLSLSGHSVARVTGGGTITGNALGVTLDADSLFVAASIWTPGVPRLDLSGNGTGLACDATSLVQNGAQIDGTDPGTCANIRP